MKKVVFLISLLPLFLSAQIEVSDNGKLTEYFPLFTSDVSASIIYDESEVTLVKKSAEFLAEDILKVTGEKPELANSISATDDYITIVGTVENNAMIKALVASGKLDVSGIKGKWEHFLIQTVRNPVPGVREALVIAGSDRRGVAYGVFTISSAIGVSPWHWWADVPVKKQPELYLKKMNFSDGPKVKYRGIFLNDEAPALTTWSREQFGGFNSRFYEKVFELLLRNRANYIWPAMWKPAMFYVDDVKNRDLADDYGIVMATSHHEPMGRAHAEWDASTMGEWNYETNKEKLQEFWRGGFERMEGTEKVVTLGMRGDGDEAMSEETATGLLKEIIEDQRAIIEEVSGKPAEETPQVWAVYKEVQDYYDKGLRVDDDVTVLFCDDNWGNLRILPKKEDLDHVGGYGIYYHFDYVGGPVSYRWLNTVQIERTWEQMKLAYEYGVRDIWIVNVGDLKPMELPISFFLDFGWNPEAIQADDLPGYYLDWAEQQFGKEFKEEIAHLLATYTKYNARRTPEMLKPDTYHVTNYNEAGRIVENYNELLAQSTEIYGQLDERYKSAYYQLVHYPIEACANINEMYVSAARNEYYATMGAAIANHYADKVIAAFKKDGELNDTYHAINDGKWNGLMLQKRIGYTSWNEPRYEKMPPISYIKVSDRPSLGFLLQDGVRENRWMMKLPEFDNHNDQQFTIELFNRGKGTVNFELVPEEEWIRVSHSSGSFELHQEVTVSIDWANAPEGQNLGTISLSGSGARPVEIPVSINKNDKKSSGYLENGGVVSINASQYSRSTDSKEVSWTVVPNMGRTGSSVITEPGNFESLEITNKSPRLEYDFTIFKDAEATLEIYLSPTQDFTKSDGLHFAVAIDDAEPVIINMNEGEEVPDWKYPSWWNSSVGDHIKIRSADLGSLSEGIHTLKVYAIDPGVVFQKFVIDTGGKKDSYLGPPVSTYVK